jgi:hypothetical protein
VLILGKGEQLIVICYLISYHISLSRLVYFASETRSWSKEDGAEGETTKSSPNSVALNIISTAAAVTTHNALHFIF